MKVNYLEALKDQLSAAGFEGVVYDPDNRGENKNFRLFFATSSSADEAGTDAAGGERRREVVSGWHANGVQLCERSSELVDALTVLCSIVKLPFSGTVTFGDDEHYYCGTVRFSNLTTCTCDMCLRNGNDIANLVARVQRCEEQCYDEEYSAHDAYERDRDRAHEAEEDAG